MRIGYSVNESGAAIRIPPPADVEIITEFVIPMRRLGLPANVRDDFNIEVYRGATLIQRFKRPPGRLRAFWQYQRFTLSAPLLRRSTDTSSLEIRASVDWTPSHNVYIEWQDGPAGSPAWSQFRQYDSKKSTWTQTETHATVAVYGPRQDVTYVELDSQRDASFASIHDDLSDRLLSSDHSNGVFNSQHQIIDINNLIASPMTWTVRLTDRDADFSLNIGAAPYNEPLMGKMMRLWQGEVLLTQGWIIAVQPPALPADDGETVITLEDATRQFIYARHRINFKINPRTSEAITALLHDIGQGYPYRANAYDYNIMDVDFDLYDPESDGGFIIDQSFTRIALYGAPGENPPENGIDLLRDLMLHEMGGYFYSERDGRLRFRDRYWLHRASESGLRAIKVDMAADAHVRRQTIRNKVSVSYLPKIREVNALVYDSGYSDIRILNTDESITIGELYHMPKYPGASIYADNPITPVPNVDTLAVGTKLVDPDTGALITGGRVPNDPYARFIDRHGTTKRGILQSNGERVTDQNLRWEWAIQSDYFEVTITNLNRDPVIIRRISIRADAIIEEDQDTIERVNLESLYKYGEHTAPPTYMRFISSVSDAEALADARLAYNSRNIEYIGQLDFVRMAGGADECFPPEAVDLGIGDAFRLIHPSNATELSYVIVGERHRINRGQHFTSWAIKPLLLNETFFMDISPMDSSQNRLSY